MHLTSPIWLAGLAPWAAAVLWLLRGSPRRAGVPFLALWQGPVAAAPRERRLAPPPVAVAAALLACLLAILAAARPSVPRATATGREPLTLVVDRGLTMSARGNADLRYREAVADAAEALRARFGNVPVRLITVPGTEVRQLDVAALPAAVAALPPTARDTRRALADVLAAQAPDSPVLVVTDQPLGTAEGSTIRIAPTRVPEDVAIVRVTVRERPTTQAMVAVRNQSARSRAKLGVSSGDRRFERDVDLPSAPGERNYFFDLPGVGPWVSAELADRDAVAANDRAWALRERGAARIEPTTTLPAPLVRVIEAYRASRPTPSDAARLTVAHDPTPFPAQVPAVVLATPSKRIDAAQIRAEAHDITRFVHWEQVAAPIEAGAPPPDGWTPLVKAGDDVLVAVSPSPPKQVWVGFDAPRWAASTDYVIFWTNVFDWAGGADGGYVSHPMDDRTPEWKPPQTPEGEWPGIYTRGDGATRAFNAPDLPIPPAAPSDWRGHLASLPRDRGETDLAPTLLILSLACLIACALTWRG